MSVKFRVFGEPAPQGSKRSVGRGHFVEASRKLMPWREAIVSQIVRDRLDGTMYAVPVAVRVTFWFDRPKVHFGSKNGQPYLRDNAPTYKTTAPDLDKLQRSLGDALTQGGVIVDDNLIVVWHAEKKYGERAGATVEVTPL